MLGGIHKQAIIEILLQLVWGSVVSSSPLEPYLACVDSPDTDARRSVERPWVASGRPSRDEEEEEEPEQHFAQISVLWPGRESDRVQSVSERSDWEVGDLGERAKQLKALAHSSGTESPRDEPPAASSTPVGLFLSAPPGRSGRQQETCVHDGGLDGDSSGLPWGPTLLVCCCRLVVDVACQRVPRHR